MKRWNCLLAVLLFFATPPLLAQSPSTAPSALAITTPLPGSTIGTSTVVEGEATPGMQVEVRVNGEIEKRLEVDKTGRFKVALSGLEPNIRLEISAIEFDDAGEQTNMVRVEVQTGDPSAVIEAPAEQPKEPPAKPAEERTAPQPAPSPPSIVPSPPMSQTSRGLLEALAGTVAGPMGASTGFIVGAFVAIAIGDSVGDFSGMGYTFFGTLAGFLIGVPAGVYITGYLLDGDGNLYLTVLASWLGTAAGVLVFAALAGAEARSLGDGGLDFLGLGLMCAIAGGSGALAFELTSNPSRRAAESQITVSPTFAPAPDGSGFVFGLGGRF